MKKSYLVCAVAAVLCSVSMASTPTVPTGINITPKPRPTIADSSGDCNVLTCHVYKGLCLLAGGKWKQFDWSSGSHDWICSDHK